MECRVEFDYEAQEEDELTLQKGDIITNVVEKMEGWWEGRLRGKTGMFPDNFVKVVEKKVSSASSESLEKTGGGVLLRNNSNRSLRRFKAVFSYAPDQDDELALEVGDVIEYLEDVEEGWWRGRLRGKVGIFPSNFVEPTTQSTMTAPAVSMSSTPPTTNGTNKEEEKNNLNDFNNFAHKRSTPKMGVVPDAAVPPAPPTTEPPQMDADDDNEPPPQLPPKPVREQARCFYPYQALNEDELSMAEGDVVTVISKSCEDEGWWRGELRGKTGLFPDNFVKIISLSDTGLSKPVPHDGPKISPQERTTTSVENGRQQRSAVAAPAPAPGTTPTATPKDTTKENGSNSVFSAVKKFSQLKFPIGGGGGGGKVGTPPSPSSSAGGFSLPVAVRNNREIKKEEVEEEKEEDFNSVERGENKLNHLTANRAKAPRRRPPSGIGKEGDDLNGFLPDRPISIESPVHNASLPFNISANSSGSSEAYHTPSANSQLENSALNGDHSPTDPAPPSKVKETKVPPWMAELKQKQDKKQANNNASSPIPQSPSTEKEPAVQMGSSPAKAPPLPAKPSTFAAPAVTPTPLEKTTVAATPTPPVIGFRTQGKKPSFGGGETVGTTNNGGGGSGDSKTFVSYEEYAKLRDRVVILETELETVRRQVKLLLDRELNNHHAHNVV